MKSFFSIAVLILLISNFSLADIYVSNSSNKKFFSLEHFETTLQLGMKHGRNGLVITGHTLDLNAPHPDQNLFISTQLASASSIDLLNLSLMLKQNKINLSCYLEKGKTNGDCIAVLIDVK